MLADDFDFVAADAAADVDVDAAAAAAAAAVRFRLEHQHRQSQRQIQTFASEYDVGGEGGKGWLLLAPLTTTLVRQHDAPRDPPPKIQMHCNKSDCIHMWYDIFSIDNYNQ